MKYKQWIIDGWYGKHSWLYILFPFALIFRIVIFLRRLILKKFATHVSIPVIVIGNITVGGTGKTPLVIYLAEKLKKQGHRPGIISRGYGGHAPHYPYAVTANSDPLISGDEALLIARRTECPVVVAPDRVSAAKALPDTCTIIISDDGLQHYALARDFEIVVLDGERRLGNGFCLPMGPLREPASRLKEVDFVVVNGKDMHLVPGEAHNCKSTLTQPLAAFKNQTIHAVAGIGNPQRFFTMLREKGLNIIEHAFPDHHIFSEKDLNFNGIILMTEKDAVKCESFAKPDWWYVPVKAELVVDFPLLF